jgi:hypothetical protein
LSKDNRILTPSDERKDRKILIPAGLSGTFEKFDDAGDL